MPPLLQERCRDRNGNKSTESTTHYVLGSGEFVEAILREAERQAAARAVRQVRHLTLDSLVQRIGATLGVPPPTILGESQSRRAAAARQLLAYV